MAEGSRDIGSILNRGIARTEAAYGAGGVSGPIPDSSAVGRRFRTTADFMRDEGIDGSAPAPDNPHGSERWKKFWESGFGKILSNREVQMNALTVFGLAAIKLGVTWGTGQNFEALESAIYGGLTGAARAALTEKFHRSGSKSEAAGKIVLASVLAAAGAGGAALIRDGSGTPSAMEGAMEHLIRGAEVGALTGTVNAGLQAIKERNFSLKRAVVSLTVGTILGGAFATAGDGVRALAGVFSGEYGQLVAMDSAEAVAGGVGFGALGALVEKRKTGKWGWKGALIGGAAGAAGAVGAAEGIVHLGGGWDLLGQTPSAANVAKEVAKPTVITSSTATEIATAQPASAPRVEGGPAIDPNKDADLLDPSRSRAAQAPSPATPVPGAEAAPVVTARPTESARGPVRRWLDSILGSNEPAATPAPAAKPAAPVPGAGGLTGEVNSGAAAEDLPMPQSEQAVGPGLNSGDKDAIEATTRLNRASYVIANNLNISQELIQSGEVDPDIQSKITSLVDRAGGGLSFPQEDALRNLTDPSAINQREVLDTVNLREPDPYYGNPQLFNNSNEDLSSLKGLLEGRVGELVLRDTEFLEDRNKIINDLLADPKVDAGVKESLTRILNGTELPTDPNEFRVGNGAHQLIFEKFRDSNPEAFNRVMSASYVLSKANTDLSKFATPDLFRHKEDIKVPKLDLMKKIYRL